MSGKKARALETQVARQTDAQQILHCLAEAFAPYREQYSPEGFADTVLNESTIKARLENMHVLVAISEGRIVGTVGAAIDRQDGHLRGMAVLPEYQGLGAAAQLLQAIEDWLRSQGCTGVSLDTTLPLQAAMKFYEKHGYRRSGRMQDFFGMPLIEYVKNLH